MSMLAVFGLVPGSAWGAAVWADAEPAALSLLSPALRASLGALAPHAIGTAPAAAHFSWLEAGVDACSLHVRLFGRASLSACLLLRAGTLHAYDSAGVAPRSSTRPWLSAGLGARARVLLAERVWVEASAAATLPWVRDRYYLEPDATIYRVSALGGQLQLGLGAQVP
jgi:hypothetical protein